MATIYLDENNICHAEPKAGYREAENVYFDTVAPDAFSCYRYIAENSMIQCIDPVSAATLQQQYEKDALIEALNRLGVKI